MVIDDPSGNSNIENLCAPNEDPQIKVSQYVRSKEQNVALGLGLTMNDVEREEMEKQGLSIQQVAQEKEQDSLVAPESQPGAPESQPGAPESQHAALKHQNQQQQAKSGSIINTPEEAERFEKKINKVTDQREVIHFQEKCYNCGKMGELRMVQTIVPYFKEIILMSFTCDECGFRSNEIKAGGPIAAKGKKITLKVTNPEDMSRDFLKSETASIDIPEIELHISQGSMGGKFTTIEGLLQALKSEFERMHQFDLGDSIEHGNKDQKQKVLQFLQTLDMMSTGTIPFTIIVDDPVANSYIQNLYAPDPDPNMIIEEYERDYEQNEELGLNDIKVENYEE